MTAPRGVAADQVEAWVAQRRDWVESVRARQAGLRSHLDPATLGPRPERIDLPAIDEQWAIGYQTGQSSQLRLQTASADDNLSLSLSLPVIDAGDVDDRIAARLRQWLRQRAEQTLIPQIESIATTHGFRYQSITFRNQRTRWGSCTARGSLSINARLLFASPAACRYVLIHELVHTRHLNHSPAFWARVAELDPDHRRHEQELNVLSQRLPDWV